MSIKVKQGRPFKNDTDGEMKKVTFRIDAETEAALEKLEAVESAVGLPGRGRRSIVLRRLILEAAANLGSK